MKADPLPDDLAINPALVEEILVRFIRNEITRTGFRRAVLGLSGGIDSSVVVYLAARALGPKNVLAVTMPYKTSSAETRDDSAVVVAALGVETLDVPITAQVDAYFAAFPQASRMRLANKCARERMTILYDQSAAFEGLVVGTSNKTELLLGYGTQFGDLASAINPIGDLYKTQLRQLAAHLGVPKEILSKPPSGDLWVGQTDEGELGFTYDEVDRLLVRLVDRRWQPTQLVEAGFDAAFVDRVLQLIRRNQYKRRLPVIAKLTHRTVDRDFRYPRLGNLILPGSNGLMTNLLVRFLDRSLRTQGAQLVDQFTRHIVAAIRGDAWIVTRLVQFREGPECDQNDAGGRAGFDRLRTIEDLLSEPATH